MAREHHLFVYGFEPMLLDLPAITPLDHLIMASNRQLDDKDYVSVDPKALKLFKKKLFYS